MARDIRRNALQHTGSHLRRRIDKMRQEDEEDAEAAREAESAGVPVPAPRLHKKITKDPNKAFSKLSQHFN